MNYIILLITILFFLLLETTIIKIPLMLCLLLVLFVRFKAVDVLVMALILGILYDVLMVNIIGTRSIYYLTTLLLVLLYDRKYEINTIYFVIISSFIIGVINSFITNSHLLINSLLTIILSIFLYKKIIYLSKNIASRKTAYK